MHGDTPYIVRGEQNDLARIFYSKPELAFTKSITIPGGYGVLPAGQFMGAITESTNRLGMYVPYAPESPDSPTWIGADPKVLPALAYLVTDGASNTNAWVSKEDSYKFAVGDHLAANDVNTDSPVDLGAITAIDRTTYSTLALITVTNNVTTAITVAQGGAVYIQTATSTPYTAAAGVLFSAVDTGVGENAKGANGVLVLKNAMLYKDLLQVYHADILSDITGSSVNGQLFIL
jgi:hypothetical protein